MNTDHLNDFIDLTEQIKKEEGILIPVGDLVSHYTSVAIQESNDQFKPTENNYYRAYLKTMKKYLLDKNYDRGDLIK